jgi:hypothetical protein
VILQLNILEEIVVGYIHHRPVIRFISRPRPSNAVDVDSVPCFSLARPVVGERSPAAVLRATPQSRTEHKGIDSREPQSRS